MLLENWESGVSTYCGMGREEDGARKVRFSINFTQTGEVGATVSLRRRRIGVMLWAEREDTVEILEDMTRSLPRRLPTAGLNPVPSAAITTIRRARRVRLAISWTTAHER
jgi:hypothetical protein